MRKEKRSKLAGGQAGRGKGRAHARNVSKTSIAEVVKGKGTGAATAAAEDEDGLHVEGQNDYRESQELVPLVILACRHIYHQSCLEAMQVEDTAGVLTDGNEFSCPIDG